MLTIGSLFSGIGGLELGLEWAGLGPVKWQVENWLACWKILEREWLDAKRFKNCTRTGEYNLEAVDLICAGDNCQPNSRARSIWGTKIPDLAGYILAVVADKRPRWLVRENVVASNDKDFVTSLELLGYGTVIIRTNAATFTGQNRIRDFIIGRYQETSSSLYKFMLSYCQGGEGNRAEKLKTKQVIPCFTKHRTRYDTRDCYIWESSEKRLRILDSEERTAFAGFPKNWTAGFSESACAKMYGQCVVPQVAQVIGEMILRFERGQNG